MKSCTVIALLLVASTAIRAQEDGNSTPVFSRWKADAVVYHMQDACYVGSSALAASGAPAKLYPAQLLLPYEVVELNRELGISCNAGTSWWLTSTPPELPSLADYLLQYAHNKTNFYGTERRNNARVRRSSRSATNPSDRLRRRLHELTQRLAPGADWTTTGVVERRGRVQLTDDPYPSPLFSRQPNGKRFKHYRAFYDEIARQANSNARSRDTASTNTSPQRNSIQSYSLRISNQPPSSVRLKSGDGQPLQRRISRNRFRSRQYPSENEVDRQISINDKRNINSENYESSEIEQNHAYNSNTHGNGFTPLAQNLNGISDRNIEREEFVDQGSAATYRDANGSVENSLIFSQAHGSAGPRGSFQAESQGLGSAGEETRSAVDGGQHGASASSSAIRLDQQAHAHVQVSPLSSGQSPPQEHSEEPLNGTPAAVSASEIEDMMRRNGFSGFAMATVSSRKKERGRNKVKPLTSLGLSVPGYADESGSDSANDLNGNADNDDYDYDEIDQGGLVGGAGDPHRESEFQQINQVEIPEGGLDASQNGLVGLATYTQGNPVYPQENEYSDDYYDFERYNHNPPLYFPVDYDSFNDPINVDDSRFRDTEGSGYFPSEYPFQPDGVPLASHDNVSESVGTYSREQIGVTSTGTDQNNFRYEEGIPYGQDIISYHHTGGLYNPSEISSSPSHISEDSFDRSSISDGSTTVHYGQIGDNSYDDSRTDSFDRSSISDGSTTIHYGQIGDNSYDDSRTDDQSNQIEYNVEDRPASPQVTSESRDYTSTSLVPSNVNGGSGMMIVDDSLQSYFLQPPNVEVPSSQQTDRFPNSDLFDYDVHSRTTDLTVPYNTYDQAGLLGGFPVIEHIAQSIPVSTDVSFSSENLGSSISSSDRVSTAGGSFLPPSNEKDIYEQNVHGFFSEDQSKMQPEIEPEIQAPTEEELPNRVLSSVPQYYPPGYNDRQPASQGIDNTLTSYSSHYGSPFIPTEGIATPQQNIPYEDRQELEVAAPTVGNAELDDYSFLNESETSDYEPDYVEIPTTYNTSHSVYSTTHHYGYQRGSNERGIGSSSNTVLLPDDVAAIPSFTGASEQASTIPFSQASHSPSTPRREEPGRSSGSQDMEGMTVLTPGSVGSTHSLPAADPNLANVKVVMAEAPRNGDMNRRTGKILLSGEKIPGTTGYLIPPGFRGRLILGNIGVTSSSQAQMMPNMNMQTANSMQGMQMRVSSSSSATSTGSGVSLSSSSSSDASPHGLLSTSSSSASSPQRQQSNFNGYNQPVYSYQQTFNSRGNGAVTNGGRPSNHQLNWQPSAQNNQGMRSKSWSSWRTSSSWSSDNSQPGSPSSGQFFSQSALQPTARDCGYWSMRCNMVFGPYKQNEICQPMHVILPCCC